VGLKGGATGDCRCVLVSRRGGFRVEWCNLRASRRGDYLTLSLISSFPAFHFRRTLSTQILATKLSHVLLRRTYRIHPSRDGNSNKELHQTAPRTTECQGHKMSACHMVSMQGLSIMQNCGTAVCNCQRFKTKHNWQWKRAGWG
jgi:hypothetical protein